MRVQIIGWNSPDNAPAFIDVPNIWISPDAKYALIERYRSEFFVFAKVLEISLEGLVCSILECYYPAYHTIDLRSYDVDWSFFTAWFLQTIAYRIRQRFLRNGSSLLYQVK